jgi:signal transduction histidine kinase
VLQAFIAANREQIIVRCRAKAALRSSHPTTGAAVDHGVPMFLDQLEEALRAGRTPSAEINTIAILHGHDLLLQGYSVSQVVHHYGDICQSITELAVETSAPITTDDFRMLNRCLDLAIAGAVTEYGRERNQSTLDGEIARGTERLGFLAHELRSLTNTAIVALEALSTGHVGLAGSTGTVLHRSLLGVRALIERSLAEVRLTHVVQNRERFLVSRFIEELAPAAMLEAGETGIGLEVLPVVDGVAVEADRQVLTAVVMNLLQNAFKFTRPDTTVTLRVGASAARVLIEVEDECGGLPPRDDGELSHPREQRSPNRNGLGLGLAFSRWGVETNRGRLYARTLPEKGCIFTIDLPRVLIPTALTESRRSKAGVKG